MSQNNTKNTSLTVSEHLDNQTAHLEALLPAGGKVKSKSTLFYIAALIAAFIICYGYASIAHSIRIKQNAKSDVSVNAANANDLSYENAYQNYQQTSLGNDISSAKNGGYTLSFNGYTIVPNADYTAISVVSNSGTYNIVGNGIAGLNLVGDTLYYTSEDGTIHSCNAADGSIDTIIPIEGSASHLTAAEGYLFYVDSLNDNCLTRCSADGSDPKVVSYRNIKSFVIVGGDAVYLTEDGKLYRSAGTTGDASSNGALIAENISDFQYNGDIIALNAGNLISFEVDKADYEELVMDQSVCSLVGAAYQHVYYTKDGTLFNLATDTLTTEQVEDDIGVVISVDNVDSRIFATRKVRNGDYYVYDNQYLN